MFDRNWMKTEQREPVVLLRKVLKDGLDQTFQKKLAQV